MELEGKRALITGASRGIGEAGIKPGHVCVLKRQVQLAVRRAGFVVVRFVVPQHVWDLGIGAIWHERISIGAGDGHESDRSTDRGCGQPRCNAVQFDPHGGTPSWMLILDSL